MNESDLSETNTPINSPGPQQQQISSASALPPSPLVTAAKSSSSPCPSPSPGSSTATPRRPQLVKQKHSFQFPDCDDPVEGQEGKEGDVRPGDDMEVDESEGAGSAAPATSDTRQSSEDGETTTEGGEKKRKKPQLIRKQSSLDVEFLNRERLQVRVKFSKIFAVPLDTKVKVVDSLAHRLIS